MVNLEANWISSEPIDFEYKQYMLLAYEQELRKNFQNKFLYPSLTNLIENHKYVSEFLRRIENIKNATKHPIGFDLTNEKLIFESTLVDDDVDEYVKIASFGYDIINRLFEEFKKLYDQIENSIEILGKKNYLFDHISGYIAVRYGLNITHYEYNISQQFYPEPTYELELIIMDDNLYYKKRFTKNVFDIFLSKDYPFNESAMPVLKRKFLTYIV